MADRAVCEFEAKVALMWAALRACIARDERDELALALWRGRADEAREWLRRACEAEEPGQLALEVAA